MSRTLCTICWVGLVLYGLMGEPAWAEVQASSGHLASRSETSSWRMLRIGDEVPLQAELRTSPLGAVSMTVNGAQLVIGADTQLRIDQQQRHLELVWGRAYLATNDKWAVAVGDHFVTASPEATLVCSITNESPRIDLASGSISIARFGNNESTHTGPLSLTLYDAGPSVTVPDSPEEWTAAVLQWTEVRRSQGLGQLVIKDAQSESATRMEIARCHVNVVLKPPVALVQLDQSFFNPFPRQQEGTFVFNLPPGASVSRFAMFVTPEELIEGELIERQRASGIYESIVRRKRDPAILEQIGDNLFRMRVFPIFARDTKRILLDFTVPVVEREGRFRFDLPLLSDLKPIWEFRLSGTIYPPVDPASVLSQLSPHLKFTADDSGLVRFSSRQKQVHPPPRLDLEYRPTEDLQPQLASYTPQESTRPLQYFVASIPTESSTEPPSDVSDVMVVVDTSGSMRELALARQAARTLLRNLPPGCRFQLACADHTFRPLTGDWHSPTPTELAEPLALLEQQFPLGESRLVHNLQEALRHFSELPAERPRQVIYIGTGEASGGTVHWRQALEPHLSGVDVSAVRIGDSERGATQLANLTGLTRGRLFRVGASRELEDLFRWSLSGCPTGSRVGAVSVPGTPGAIVYTDSSFTPGETLYVYGRTTPRKELPLSVEIDGKQRSFTFRSEKSADDDMAIFTGRLWAQRRLESLQYGQKVPTAIKREQIIRTSREWSLLSPLTAFLVLETEADYDRWGIDRKLRRRYWKPPEALPAIPLPEELATTERPIVSRPNATEEPLDQMSDEEFAKRLSSVRTALEGNEPALAHRRLLGVKSAAEHRESEEYTALLDEANRQLDRDRALNELGIHRPLFDPGARLSLPQGNVLSTLIGSAAIGPDFLKSHPLAPQMMKRVSPTSLTPTLDEFVAFLRQQTGWNLIVDEDALLDDGIDLTEVIDLRGIREMTIRNLMHHVLKDLGLTTHPAPHLMTITTITDAEDRLEPRSYPVVDLVRSDVLPRPESLSHPYLDSDSTFERRINAALDKSVSVNLEGVTVDGFRDWLDAHLQTNVMVDRIALLEDGIAAEEMVRLRPLKLNDVPLRLAVDTALRALGLTYDVDREMVRITSEDAAEDLMQTRLYSAVGIVYELPRELVELRRNDWFGGYGRFGGGSFGGGAMGGSFGGGGGFGVGGGGFGGGGGGLSGGFFGTDTPDPPDEAIGLSVVEPPATGTDTDATESLVDEEPPSPVEQEVSEAGDPGSTEAAEEELMIESQEIIDLLQNDFDADWINTTGIGGSMDFYAPSMALVIKQTDRVHRRIAAELQQLRDLPAAGQRVRAARFPVVTEDSETGWDMGDLINIIEEHLPSEPDWIDTHGIGGSIAQHVPSMSLMITQTSRVHEEIDILLTQLRRAIFENRQRLKRLEQGLPVMDQPLLTQQVTLTNWPVTSPPSGSATEDELDLLRVRQVPSAATSRWRSSSGESSSEFTVRHDRGRLAMATDVVALRADGARGAIHYPQLTRVELGNWGETIRRVSESALPWLPHVSNKRLAAQFNVRAGEESAEGVSLQFVHASEPRLSISATFDRQSGQPTVWEVSFDGQLQNRLDFDRQNDVTIVRALDPRDQELARWEQLEFQPHADLPALDEHPPMVVVVDQRDEDSALLGVHEALAQFQYQDAVGLLDGELASQPEQPMLNFLLAWACEQGQSEIADAERRKQQALGIVVRSSAEDLIELVSAGNFPAADQEDLLSVMKDVAHQRPSLVILDSIVKLSLRQNQDAQALLALEDALSLPGGKTAQRQVTQVDLLLKLDRVRDAQSAATQLSSRHGTVAILSDLGDLFGRHQLQTTADGYFNQATDRAGADSRTRKMLLLRQANWHTGAARWRLLAKVAGMTPDSDSAANAQLQTILYETNTAQDADLLGELAAESQVPAHQAALLIQQASLTDDDAEAAEICRRVLEFNSLSGGQESWVLRKLRETGNNKFLAAYLEEQLRNGQWLGKFRVTLLADVYEERGEAVAARRTRSDWYHRTGRR